MNMLCYHFPLFSLLILLRNHIILGVNVTVTADGTICVGNNITVTCKIDPFTTPPSASWNRNGVPLSTCTSGGICTTDSLVINGITYSFLGGSNEIKVSLQVQQVETGIQWNCDHNGITYPYTFSVQNECPISQMSTSIATEGTTSSNSVSEFSNITLPMISGSTTTTIGISALTSIILNTGTTHFHSSTQTTHFYVKTETTTSYASTETSNFDANTQTNKIQTNTLRIISNSMSTYQSMFVTTAVNDISGSLESTSQMMTETFALPGYSTPSYNERTITSRFETSNVFPQMFSVTSIFFSLDTLSDTLFHNLHVSSGSLITKYAMLSMTISPLMSTTLTDQISYFSKIEDPSFSYHQYVSETTVILPKISENSPMPSAVIDTNNQTSHTTNKHAYKQPEIVFVYIKA